MSEQHPPIHVEIIRGPEIESRHRVHAVLTNGKGDIKAVHGDAALPVFARSSIKALQAISLVESGAADQFNVSDVELALACASHFAEPRHVTAVQAWLKRLGLAESDLECGPQPPYERPVSEATPVCNNCSGTHTGMLTLALFMKEPTKGYTDVQHPVQQKIIGTMGDMAGMPLTMTQCGVDGCSAPAPVLPLQAWAKAFSSFMMPEKFGAARASACNRLMSAAMQNPFYVGGTKRLDTILMEASGGKIFSKAGAEATHVMAIPSQDTVIAIKTEDGAHRGTQAAVHALLQRYKLADDKTLDAIASVSVPVIRNWQKTEVGKTQVSF